MSVDSPLIPNIQNRLWLARKRVGYPQKWVRRLLRKRSLATVSEYEQGRKVPPLLALFKLQLIYQMSLPELYPDLFATAIQELTEDRRGIPAIDLCDAEVRKISAEMLSLQPPVADMAQHPSTKLDHSL